MAPALPSAAEVDPKQERRDGDRFSRMTLAPVEQIATYQLVNILAGNYGSRQTIRRWQWMFDAISTIIFSTLRHVLGRSDAILIDFRRLRKRSRFSHYRSVNILTGYIVLKQVIQRQKILDAIVVYSILYATRSPRRNFRPLKVCLPMYKLFTVCSRYRYFCQEPVVENRPTAMK